VVIELSAPHPWDGLRVKVAPAFFASFKTVAETVIRDDPASTVEDDELEVRLTLTVGVELPPPQLASIVSSSIASVIASV
jgi:hypothetical protein